MKNVQNMVAVGIQRTFCQVSAPAQSQFTAERLAAGDKESCAIMMNLPLPNFNNTDSNPLSLLDCLLVPCES